MHLGVSRFFHDLRRRRVLRVGGIYLVAAWLIIQVVTTVFPLLGLPDRSPQLVLLLLAFGFPAALVLAWFFDIGPRGIERTPPLPVPERSVAVLPFTDLSRDRDHEYVADGIADEVLAVLAQARELRVAARTSSFAYRGRQADVREIGRQLGVATVLEGSVRVVNDRLRVSAQLVDVSTGYQRWSRRFDCPLDDVFRVQDEIAAEIATALDVNADALPRAAAPVPEAYEFYLRGRHYFHRKTVRAWRAAEQLFARALEADPNFAPALAGHADTCAFLYMYHDGSEAVLRCADESSQRALELGPDVAEAHVSRGLALSLRKRFPEATAEFERALALNPRSFEAHYFHGRALFAVGDMAAAAQHFRTATELQPDSYDTWGLLAAVLLGLGDRDGALDAQRRTVAAAEHVLRHTPDDVRALYFGAAALVHVGERERGLEWARRAVATEPDDPGVHYNVACLYAQAELLDEALHHLERALALGFAHREWIENDPDLHALRATPRYQALLAAT